jgi:hypothetical protein
MQCFECADMLMIALIRYVYIWVWFENFQMWQQDCYNPIFDLLYLNYFYYWKNDEKNDEKQVKIK